MEKTLLLTCAFVSTEKTERQLAVVSCELSVVSCELTVGSCELSVGSCELSVEADLS